uniref:Uncharacterized protein n=1 Tax=Cucumis melo TaxID=3656 RepID=A0A9I9D6Z4_CUCME
MDGATSFMRMEDRNCGWVRGDATTAVGASWTNRLEQTQSTRFRFKCRDAEIWLTEREAARDVAAWANDKQKLDGELR